MGAAGIIILHCFTVISTLKIIEIIVIFHLILITIYDIYLTNTKIFNIIILYHILPICVKERTLI